MRAPLAIISTILLYLPAISLVWYEVKYWGIYSWQELPIKFLFLGKLLFSDSYSPEMGNLAHHWQSVPLSRTCEPCQLIPSASLLILADRQQEITCSLLPALVLAWKWAWPQSPGVAWCCEWSWPGPSALLCSQPEPHHPKWSYVGLSLFSMSITIRKQRTYTVYTV